MKIGDLVQVMHPYGPHAGKVGIITGKYMAPAEEKSRSYDTVFYIQDEHGFEYMFYPRSLRVIG